MFQIWPPLRMELRTRFLEENNNLNGEELRKVKIKYDLYSDGKDTPEDQEVGRWGVGQKCLARWREDSVWYKAEVVTVDTTSYTVLFLDFGNQGVVGEGEMVGGLEELLPYSMVDETVLAEGEARREALFTPALSQQRYTLVVEELAKRAVTRVADLGCSSCRLLAHLRGLLPSASLLVGVDIDREVLEEEGRRLRPLPGDWLNRREEPLAVELYRGSCGDMGGAARLAGRVQAVTMVEVIKHLHLHLHQVVEHLDPSTLAATPSAVLEGIQPKVPGAAPSPPSKVWLVTSLPRCGW